MGASYQLKSTKMAKPGRYISNSKWLKLPVFVKFDAFCYKIAKQQPSRCACYTAAFGCLQPLIAIQQPLAAFKLCLINSSL